MAAEIACDQRRLTLYYRQAMEFAVPRRGNRLTVSVLMTPTECDGVGGNLFMLVYLWVGLGGAMGTIARFWLNGIVSRFFGETFPVGTLAVNVTGSFVIGVLGALTVPEGRLDSPSRTFATQFLMIGICGGYTTFSSFSLQTLNLLRDREWLYAGGNVILSVVLCLLAVWFGYLLGAAFSSMKGN
jgi:CrcB protein